MLDLQPAATVKPMRDHIDFVPDGDGVRLTNRPAGVTAPIIIGLVIALFVGLICGWSFNQLLGLAAAALVAAVAALFAGRRLMLGQALAPAELTLNRWPLRPGESVTLRYRQRLKRQVAVRRVVPRLHCLEWARYCVGTDTRTVTHTSHEQSPAVVPIDRLLDELTGEWQITLPADALPSFAAPDNKVTWTFTVAVEIDNHPDATASFPLLIADG